MSRLQSFLRPRALRQGDPVAVIAPASAFDRASFETGLAVIGERYRVRYDEHILARHRYLAGDDARRLAELIAALTDPASKAVFCARGGYGAMRLLASLAAGLAVPAAPALAPKPLIGFSDITALHQFLQHRGLVSIHGPTVTQLGRLSQPTRARLFSLLESAAPAQPLYGTDTYVGGIAEGPLLGGNLSVFTYRLDRMWTHLELAGVFRNVSGIALGEFIGCEEKDSSYTSAEVLRELAAATGLPCAAGFPIGHGENNEPVPLGVRVHLDAGSRSLTFLEPAVA
ncbi:MAG: LD-carboxypeptidase [Gammaproteobacteria bacterium]|nr:MAG: LD-carboxypeptidase [Gammaproteobacteria bacterium]